MSGVCFNNLAKALISPRLNVADDSRVERPRRWCLDVYAVVCTIGIRNSYKAETKRVHCIAFI